MLLTRIRCPLWADIEFVNKIPKILHMLKLILTSSTLININIVIYCLNGKHRTFIIINDREHINRANKLNMKCLHAQMTPKMESKLALHKYIYRSLAKFQIITF